MDDPKPTAKGYDKGPTGSRGYVSPLGGATTPYQTDRQIYGEKRDRAQTPIDYGKSEKP